MALPAPSAAILFDLDGTLTDPFVGITSSIRYALEKLGRTAPPADDLRWCIGPPLYASFPKLLSSNDPAETMEAVRLYRERYSDVGKFENVVIEGVPDMLEAASQLGYPMFVATSKLATYAEEIIEHFDISKYFRALYGSGLDGKHSDKSELIAHLLKTEGIEPSHAIMIGDRSHDVVGALANHVTPIGVLWGYGDRAELQGAGAGIIADKPSRLPGLIERALQAD